MPRVAHKLLWGSALIVAVLSLMGVIPVTEGLLGAVILASVAEIAEE